MKRNFIYLLRRCRIKENFIYLLDYDEDVEEFARWAFGDGYLNLYGGREFMTAWNTLHGKELNISPVGIPSEDAPSMIMLWRRSR